MPDFGLLGSLTEKLHQEFVNIYYLMLPVFFSLALVVAWFRASGNTPDFMDVLKRAVISMILLVAFPDITHAISFIAQGITDKIDAVNSLDNFIQMVKEKSQNYSNSPTSILLQFNDLLIATLSFLSYLVLYIARYLTVAIYHFFWIFFTISSPLMLLFNLFQGTSQITVNLFKGMIEVASWKIVWAILGAMLTALSLGDAYKADGNYLTLIVMNFVIAVAMLMTPMIVRSLVGAGFHSMSTSLGAAAVTAMVATPARLTQVGAMGRDALNGAGNFMRNNFNSGSSSGGGNTSRPSTAGYAAGSSQLAAPSQQLALPSPPPSLTPPKT